MDGYNYITQGIKLCIPAITLLRTDGIVNIEPFKSGFAVLSYTPS
jgi:hypothetical protein